VIKKKDNGSKDSYIGQVLLVPPGMMRRVVEAVSAAPELLQTTSEPPTPLPDLQPEDVIAIRQMFNGWNVAVDRDGTRFEGRISTTYIDLPPLTEKTAQACTDLLHYIRTIVEPARQDLQASVDAGTVALHRLYGANLCVAHAVDYIFAIRKADGFKGKRKDLVPDMDKVLSVEGARIRNQKFELIDAVNNAFKHIRIEPDWYPDVIRKYGEVSFQSLVQDEGRVLCILKGYRFDYARAVLLPAFEALCDWNFSSIEDIRRFARGEFVVLSTDEYACVDSDWDDPIDDMHDLVHPRCLNCGEYQADCQCAEYVFDGKRGRFESRFVSDEEFDDVMSRISGAYRRERD
jgi:hypothetical protein